MLTTAPPSALVSKLEADGVATVVQYHRSAFTLSQLEAASTLLEGTDGVLSAGPAANGNGLDITTTAAAANIPVSVTLSSGLSVPIIVSTVDPTQIGNNHPMYLDRYNETDPFQGGGLIKDDKQYLGAPQQEQCSTGVAVSFTGGKGMTTDQHCQANTWYSAGNNSLLGHTHAYDVDSDSQVVGQPNVQAKIYSGAYNSSTTHPVRDGGDPNQGDMLCLSDGITGELCNLTVGRADYMEMVLKPYRGYGFDLFNYNKSKSNGKYNCEAQAGDSGSPGYRLNSDGSATVRGIISLGLTNTDNPCGGNPEVDDPSDFSEVFMIQISSFLFGISSTLLTTS